MTHDSSFAGGRSGKSFRLNRRDWMRLSAAGVAGASMSGWFGAFAEEAARRSDRRGACILLWMSGGPSQMDTFDLKPGHANGGTFKEIETAVSGIKISEHLPQAGEAGKTPGHRPFDEHQRRRPFAGHVVRSPRLSPPGPDPLSDVRLADRQRAGERRSRTSRISSASPPLGRSAPRRMIPVSSAPGSAPLDGRRGGRGRCGRHRRRRFESRRPPARAGNRAGDSRCAARQAPFVERQVLRSLRRIAGRQLPRRLRPGGAAHAEPGGFRVFAR